MIATLLAMLAAPLMFLLGIRRRPVSYPGDARKKKCTRKARWADKETSIAPGSAWVAWLLRGCCRGRAHVDESCDLCGGRRLEVCG